MKDKLVEDSWMNKGVKLFIIIRQIGFIDEKVHLSPTA